MSSQTQSGPPYELVGIELQEFESSKSISRPETQASRAPSRLSGLDGKLDVSDERKTFLSPQIDPTTSSLLDGPLDDGKIFSQPLRKRRHRFKSWKIGVLAAAGMTTTILVINSVLTLWASLEFGLEEGGIGTAYDGDCDTVSAWSFWLHLVINALSSALLGASNYTMQCVSAPTRYECDQAHSQRDWLDIGIPSIRNIFRISWQRRTLWVLLALSSTPVHLLYNSAVFKTLDNNLYSPVLFGPSFLDGETVPEKFSEVLAVQLAYMADISSFKNLSPEACIETYSTYYLSGHGDVILISEALANGTLSAAGLLLPEDPRLRRQIDFPFDWMCSGIDLTCNSPAKVRELEMRGNWTINGIDIDYCLSEDQPQHCKLQFSSGILIAVIICNGIKCVAMFWTIWRQRDTTFITFGDALASWLDEPDPTTADHCFEDSRSIECQPKRRHPPRALGLAARRWKGGASRRRWFASMAFVVLTLLATWGGFGGTMVQMKRETGETITSLGFGAVNSRMLLGAGLPTRGVTGLTASVLVANLPQLILSCVYLSFNGLITCMLLAREYSGYEVHRKPLRVTTPCGQQRTTYWLQIPYIYGIPLMVISATLHWLISQSVFLVRVEEYSKGILKETNVSAVGLSPAPMLVVAVLGLFTVAVVIGLGRRKLKGKLMPVAASCSRALASAAHRPAEDVDASILPVKWGEAKDMGDSELGHCCFTSRGVYDAVPGRRYR